MVKPFVLGLVEKEGKYLFLNRIDPPKVWSPPGGWLDKGENPEDGLLREIKEETNLKVKIICPIHVFYKSKTNSLGFVYICQYISGKVKISFEHMDFMWKTLKEMKTEKINCSPSVRILEKGEKILSCLKRS
ncbi:NUDIX hydrolase [Maledivibacter halophilus]|uniref:ADP-ribose pyrophosphatase n=1 Tax=Maledivibacter halophilus TaxID=36842 RepID=A0A1T5JAH4_9FIRM|nr:NUDIX hydrolase [Maledivibacter halophilus]SKC48450.1 ADP-ribose pyrophosphatase [Maledivibacter halophilus]